jgi:hypothetical protein
MGHPLNVGEEVQQLYIEPEMEQNEGGTESKREDTQVEEEYLIYANDNIYALALHIESCNTHSINKDG